MIEREKRTRGELEEMCFRVLAPKLGLQKSEVLVAASSRNSWTWDVEIPTDHHLRAEWMGAAALIRELQQTYDLTGDAER